MLSQIHVFINAIKNYYKNYFNFHGTANRPEFWYPFLYNTLIFVTFIFIAEPNGTEPNVFILISTESNILILISVVLALLYFANIIPTISVTLRRMHDTNRSGWKILWGIIPLGWIYLLICVAGESRPNHWKTLSHFEGKKDSGLQEAGRVSESSFFGIIFRIFLIMIIIACSFFYIGKLIAFIFLIFKILVEIFKFLLVIGIILCLILFFVAGYGYDKKAGIDRIGKKAGLLLIIIFIVLIALTSLFEFE